MSRPSSLLFILALVLAAPVAAQAPPDGRAAARVQALQAAIAPGKQIFVARQLNLTPAEAADFWPVYDAHQAELGRLEARRAEIRGALAAAQGKDAVNLAEDYRRLAIREAERLEETFDRLSRNLPLAKALLYVQLESSLRALRHFEEDAADAYAGG